MTRYVITPDVAIELAEQNARLGESTKLVAPTLLRSQVLSILYQRARQGELTKKQADGYLDYLRGLKIRLLGDRVLQSVAWQVAGQLGWSDTFAAEYVALTLLQADVLVTKDDQLREAAAGLVSAADVSELLA